MGEQFVIGMDGGGTTTNVIVAKTDGSVVKSFQIGSLNINGQARETTETTIKTGLEEITKLNLELKDCVGICIGAAGTSNADTQNVITQILRNNGVTGVIKIVGDHETALAGALDGTCGVILIAGTGSICFGVTENGKEYRAGGFGHLIDDAGSAYAIGRDILKAIVRDYDGRGVSTVLTKKTFAQLQCNTVEELITWVYSQNRNKKEIAALAVLLEEGILEGDKVSNAILRDTVMELIELAQAILPYFKEDTSFIVSGSVLMKNEEIYRIFCEIIKVEYPKLKIAKMRGTAAEGALKIIQKEISTW